MLVLVVVLIGVMAAPATAQEGSLLDEVLGRGYLICGVNQELFGFGYLEDTGEIVGFDVDFCHAFAAAIFGDADAVELAPHTAATRLPAVQTGEVDVLVRNTTWTLTRDTENGVDFGPTNFYDGQSMMTRVEDGITDFEGLEGLTICSTSGTTTELNVTDQMTARGLDFDLLTFESTADTNAAFMEGRCAAETSDQSQLAALRAASDNPAAYLVWDTVFSKEPLGPVYRQNDSVWAGVIDWTVYGLVQAEEFGITSENIDDFLRAEGESDEDYTARVGPEIARFLDADLGIGSLLGLENDFIVEVIRQVGNYGEIYNRHLGPDAVVPIPRGVNNLWSNGGLIYAPAWR
jgi:general L-amino acid transport system substrate-binding protein